MYSLKNILTQSPNVISGAVVAVVNFCLIQGWVTLPADGVAALNVALICVLGLFVATVNASNKKEAQLEGIALGKEIAIIDEGADVDEVEILPIVPIAPVAPVAAKSAVRKREKLT